MGAGPALPSGSPGHGTNNTKIVPILLVPGVMGTRLNLPGTAFNWDPNDDAEMAGWVKSPSRRELVRRLDPFKAPATIATELDANTNLKQPNVDPLADIRKRSRLQEIVREKLEAENPALKGRFNGRALPGSVHVHYQSRGWGEVVWSFYGNLLMDLTEQLNPSTQGGELHPVYACGYDWRQSNLDSARTFRDRVALIRKNHPAAKQIIAVTHSMGGLVVRTAILLGSEPDLRGVVHCVIPADGAVVAYRRFFTGASNIAEGNTDPLNIILGPNRVEYGVTQSVLRGPVELLPHESYPEVFFRLADGTTNRDTPDLFAAYADNDPPGFVVKAGEKASQGFPKLEVTVTPDDTKNLREAIRSAGAFTRRIRGIAHKKTFLVIGDKVRTDMEVDFRKAKLTVTGAGAEAIAIKRDQGDGTVPAPSAEFRAAKDALGSVKVTGATHAACFDVKTFTTTVIANIRVLVATP